MPLSSSCCSTWWSSLGVLLSEAVAMARRGGPIRIELSCPWVAIACLVALVVFPAVWREIGAMAEASLMVQMGLAAQGGVFWGVLMAGAEKQAAAARASDVALWPEPPGPDGAGRVAGGRR